VYFNDHSSTKKTTLSFLHDNTGGKLKEHMSHIYFLVTNHQ